MNLFFKFLPSLLITFFTTVLASHAQTSGYGCRDGNRIYVNYLGISEWYGTAYKVYDVHGISYEIYYNSDPANNYDCHKVNSNQAYHQVRDESYAGSNGTNQTACWIDSSAGKKNTTQGSYATYVFYQIDCPANKAANLPMDDFTPFFIPLISLVGFSILRRVRVIG